MASSATPSDLRRLTLAVDLHPLLSLPSPSPYSTPILATARRLLPSSPLCSHMPFLSSLTPLLSFSALRRLLPSPHFDLPSSTLSSLSRTLQHPLIFDLDPPVASPRASLIAQSLFQLACDSLWDDDGDDGKNLLLVFSPLPRTPEGVEEFVGAGKVAALLGKAFAAVKTRLDKAKVSVCWVDVNYDGGRGMREVIDGIVGMGWCVTSTDEVGIGFNVVPFGIAYPRICGGLVAVETAEKEIKGRAELFLEISDISGQPMECKCCVLEVFDKMPHTEKSAGGFLGELCNGTDVKIISVKGVGKADEVEGNIGTLLGTVVLRGLFVDREKKRSKGTLEDGFFGDVVIELLCGGKGDLVPENPVWQLILIFLYRRNLCALVSMARDGDKSSLLGVIKPFTVNSAVLSIFDAWKEGSRLTCMSASCVPGESSKDTDRNSKLEKRKLQKLCNLSWREFREFAFKETGGDGQNINIEEVFLVKDLKDEKKMRFLQCWMKQMKRSLSSPSIKLDGDKLVSNTDGGNGNDNFDSQQERESRFSSSTAGETEVSQSLNEENQLPSPVEDLETLARSIPGKIEHGLSCEAVGLGDLAERLVELATRASFMSFQRTIEESQGIESTSTDGSYDFKVVLEVSKLLLRKPRDLAAKYKSFTPAPIANESSTIHPAGRKIRENEMQILFRMEILRSSIGLSIDDNMKSKMIKDICSFLENIEFDLQGDTFSGESLINFVERTIKTRYIVSLGDIIHKIYTRMEFLTFDGGDEDSGSAPNNNNHNDESQEKLGHCSPRDAGGDCDKNPIDDAKPLPARTSTGNSVERNCKSKNGDHRVKKAVEKRERARRFSHFTSWTQNLQRVWAPKVNKTDRLQQGHADPVAERRNMVERRRKTSRNEIVLETPMTSKKHRIEGNDSIREDAELHGGSSRLISKALFHDKLEL